MIKKLAPSYEQSKGLESISEHGEFDTMDKTDS